MTLSPDEKIYFEIVSKKGINTTSKIQNRFSNDQKFYKKLHSVNNIELIKKTFVPEKESQMTGVEFIIGIAGNLLASYIYDLIKYYKKGSSSLEVATQSEKTTIIVESADYQIKISTSLTDPERIKDLVSSLVPNSK